MEIFDIAIIGLGTAGSTLASLLDKRLKVIAIDKKNNETQSYKKPCGGLLAPDAQKVLAKLNINLPKEILVDPQIFYVKTHDMQTGLVRNYLRHYINMDRHKFDCWFISMIPKNIILQDNSVCVNIEKTKDFYKVDYIKNNETKVIYAKNVVGSDGANSKVRKLVTKTSPEKYIAIQEWFDNKDEDAFYTCIFDKTITPIYAYTMTKDHYCLVCGILESKNCAKNFVKLKNTLGLNCSKPIIREACMVLKPRKMSDFCTGKNGVFLIGEAAGFVSPSSFEGISYAIESAILLSQVLNSNQKNKNKLYRKKTFALRCKLLSKHLKAKFLFNPFLRKLIMKSGLNAITLINKP